MAGNVIYANTRQLDQIAELLGGYPKDAVRIMNSVLSRTADTVRVEAGRQIPRVFGAPQKEIKSALNSKQRKVKTVMGTSGTGSISVVVLGRPLTITRFQHVPTSPVKKNKGGKKRNVQPMVKIYREKGMLPLGPVRGTDGKNNKVFLAPVKNGTEGRYLFAVRNGPRKYRILRSLSVPQMVTNEGIGTVIVDKVNEAIMKRLTHELDRTFGNLGTNLAKGAR